MQSFNVVLNLNLISKHKFVSFHIKLKNINWLAFKRLL